jgi:hypothetical protein
MVQSKHRMVVQSKHNIVGTNQAQLFMSLKGEHKIGTKIAHNRHKINTVILAQHESTQTRTERHMHGT